MPWFRDRFMKSSGHKIGYGNRGQRMKKLIVEVTPGLHHVIIVGKLSAISISSVFSYYVPLNLSDPFIVHLTALF